MEKVTLSFVGRYTTDKNNNPLVSKKTGKPYTSLRIKTNEHGDKYLSGFDSAETKEWKVGDVVEVEVEQKGEYLNFSVPKANHRPAGGGMSEEQFALLMREVRAINTNVLRVWAEVDPEKNMTSAGTKVPDFSEVGEVTAPVFATDRTLPNVQNDVPEFTDDDFPQF